MKREDIVELIKAEVAKQLAARDGVVQPLSGGHGHTLPGQG